MGAKSASFVAHVLLAILKKSVGSMAAWGGKRPFAAVCIDGNTKSRVVSSNLLVAIVSSIVTGLHLGASRDGNGRKRRYWRADPNRLEGKLTRGQRRPADTVHGSRAGRLLRLGARGGLDLLWVPRTGDHRRPGCRDAAPVAPLMLNRRRNGVCALTRLRRGLLGDGRLILRPEAVQKASRCHTSFDSRVTPRWPARTGWPKPSRRCRRLLP